MAFLATADQLDLQRNVREVLADRWPLGGLVAAADAGAAASGPAAQSAWQALVETGVFDLHGELGLGWTEAALVFVELGRALAAGPLVATYLISALADPPVDALGTPIAVADLSRTPVIVGNLDVAQHLLVIGDRQASVVPVDDELRSQPIAKPIDPLTALHRVDQPLPHDNVDRQPVDHRLPPDKVDQLRWQGALLTASYQVGIAGRLVELAVDYAKVREQFDRPIGGFQAVKHLCADMYARAELARVAVEAAAVTIDMVTTDDEAAGDPGRAVAGAKLLADEAASANGRSSIQVHGGIGFTWELPVHLFLKRAWLLATEWVTADEAAEQVAQAL